eukprot:TRINITY_DN11666_c0_g1_i1.p1 TRINITY_DN11666_c0_g1~~TRINITY_DN11666_c0_g1_i1.p1  ORF type:complete len:770 (-),score=167.10 TRINITY_DN11666_c0_g1_i1:38-2347(-)
MGTSSLPFRSCCIGLGVLAVLVLCLFTPGAQSAGIYINTGGDPIDWRARNISVARYWNEVALRAIRNDSSRAPVHSRNLFHLSVVMWNAWAAYSPLARQYQLDETVSVVGWSKADIEQARFKSISFAAYTLLKYRYSLTTVPQIQSYLDARLNGLGLNVTLADEDGSPASLGVRLAEKVINTGKLDGAAEASDYNPGFNPYNDPYVPTSSSSVSEIKNPNKWAMIARETDPDDVQRVPFTGAQWGQLPTFGLDPNFDAVPSQPGVWLSPQDPLSLPWPASDEASTAPFTDDVLAFQRNYTYVLEASSWLDAAQNVTVDASPASNAATLGNTLPRSKNPSTGSAYEQQNVNRADLYRAIAEFWAEGPSRETAPGLWNVILNSLSSSPAFERRWAGDGLPLDQLEWDVKSYLALNAALNDAAVAAFGAKAYFETARPMTIIRWMGWKGQSSDASLPSYNRYGLPLVNGLIELVTANSSQPGERHAHLNASVGSVAVRAWKGSFSSATSSSGVGWILAREWWPYWKPNYINPPFAAYVSAHTTFCTAAAQILTTITGNEFFPGGLARWAVAKNSLKLDHGPADPFELQWATYLDAATQCSMARVLGGNHAVMDTVPATQMGLTIGKKAYNHAMKYFRMDAMSQTEVVMSILVLIFMFAAALFGTSYGLYKLRPQFAASTADLIRELRRRITPGADVDNNQLSMSDLSASDYVPPPRPSPTKRRSRASRTSFQRERESYIAGQASIPLDQIELDSSFSAPSGQRQQDDLEEYL